MDETKLYFHPLYFIFHDCWSMRVWQWIGNVQTGGFREISRHQHRGHVHFFMPRHDIDSPKSGQAYTGSQTYNFALNETWSPNSSDPNQTRNIRIVGSPKWYFYIKEYWRRIYLQRWEYEDEPSGGIKWDASFPFHTYGPFREGKDNLFYWTNTPRTLPVEYWLNEKKTIRDHLVRYEPSSEMNMKWDASEDGFDAGSEWQIPKDAICGSREPQDCDPESYAARRYGWGDNRYIFPTMEYQSVVHRDWERLHGENQRLDGDGFEISVSLPYRIEGLVQSPFSDDNGVVSPPGTYHHGFDVVNPDHILKYAPTNNVPDLTGILPPPNPEWTGPKPPIHYDRNEYLIPEHLLGTRMGFNVPSHLAGMEDGVWVEQCLGGIVLAKALVTIQDNFGGVSDVWVTDTQFMVRDNFEGKDQDASAT